MSCTQMPAVSRHPTPGLAGDENTDPGSDGTITSNASAGSPSKRSGCASGSITFAKSQNVHGHPWVSTSGSGAGPEPRSWSACTVTPSISPRTCGHRFMAASCARQSYSSIQYATSSRRYVPDTP